MNFSSIHFSFMQYGYSALGIVPIGLLPLTVKARPVPTSRSHSFTCIPPFHINLRKHNQDFLILHVLERCNIFNLSITNQVKKIVLTWRLWFLHLQVVALFQDPRLAYHTHQLGHHQRILRLHIRKAVLHRSPKM